MRKPPVSLVLLQAALVIAGCSSERIADPLPVPVKILTSVKVPTTISLLPGSQELMSVKAYDQDVLQMAWELSDVKYSSSDPSIASVDSKGLVTGVRPGSVDVQTTLTIRGVTLQGVTAVSVGAVPRAGRYILDAPITNFYSGWGEYTCCRFTAVITLAPHDGLPRGTFSDFTIIKPDGSRESRGGGEVSGLNSKGSLVLMLWGPGTLWRGTITEPGASSSSGNFNYGDLTATGTFTLTLAGD